MQYETSHNIFQSPDSSYMPKTSCKNRHTRPSLPYLLCIILLEILKIKNISEPHLYCFVSFVSKCNMPYMLQHYKPTTSSSTVVNIPLTLYNLFISSRTKYRWDIAWMVGQRLITIATTHSTKPEKHDPLPSAHFTSTELSKPIWNRWTGASFYTSSSRSVIYC